MKKENSIEKLNNALFLHDLEKQKILESHKSLIEIELKDFVIDFSYGYTGFGWEQFCFEDGGENYFMIEDVWLINSYNHKVHPTDSVMIKLLENVTDYVKSIPALFMEHIYKSPCQVIVNKRRIEVKPI